MSPSTVERVVHRTQTLRRRALHPLRSDDAVAQSADCRSFLWSTQNMIVSSVSYPGGLAALIQDRERVTLRLVRLLRND